MAFLIGCSVQDIVVMVTDYKVATIPKMKQIMRDIQNMYKLCIVCGLVG